MSLTLPPFTFEQLRGDVYFLKDFMELNGRHGVFGMFGEDFMNGVGVTPIPGSEHFDTVFRRRQYPRS
jgi:hypothetical protein